MDNLYRVGEEGLVSRKTGEAVTPDEVAATLRDSMDEAIEETRRGLPDDIAEDYLRGVDLEDLSDAERQLARESGQKIGDKMAPEVVDVWRRQFIEDTTFTDDMAEKYVHAADVGSQLQTKMDEALSGGRELGVPRGEDILSPAEVHEQGLKATMTADDLAGGAVAARRSGGDGFLDRWMVEMGDGTKKTKFYRSASLMDENAPSMFKHAIRGGQAVACNSRFLRSQALQEIIDSMSEDELDFWKSEGRCAAFSGGMDAGIKGMCERAGVPGEVIRPTSGTGKTATAACGAATFAGFTSDYMASAAYKNTRGGINSMYLKRAFAPPIELPMHPVANYWFTTLNPNGGAPDSRFYLVSPVSTTDVKGADDARIVVRPGTIEQNYRARGRAEDRGNEGPHGALDKGVCESVLASLSTSKGAVNSVLSKTPLLDRFISENEQGYENEYTVGEARSANLRGTFYMPSKQAANALVEGTTGGIPFVGNAITSFNELADEVPGVKGFSEAVKSACASELMYIPDPLVRRTPGPDAPHTPPGFDLHEWGNLQQVEGPKASSEREEDIALNHFEQLWFWNGECKPEGDGEKCKYAWEEGGSYYHDDWQKLQDEDAEDWNGSMHARLYAGGEGTTVFEGKTSFDDAWELFKDNIPFFGSLDFDAITGQHTVQALQVNFEGMPDDNWRTTDENAVYGYNSDIDNMKWAEAGVIAGSIAAEIGLAVAASALALPSGGTSLAAGRLIVGGLDVAAAVGLQWIKKETAWPNH
jgi:hypothetical protein